MNRHNRRKIATAFPGKLVDTQIVIFRRADAWYPLELPIGDDIARHAEVNPGTLKVEAMDGTVLWSLQ